jgi:putative oxidoreductase
MKVSHTMEVSGDAAAALANMGVLKPPAPPAANGPAPSKPETPPETKPEESKPSEPKPGGGAVLAAGPRVILVRQAAARQYTAADFPAPVRVRALYMLAVMLHGAANPPPVDAGAAPKMRLWPPALADGSKPVYLAWAVAITELGGGVFLLLGLLTRAAALGVGVVMLGALWLTQIGPAIQSGSARLGFLPSYDAFDGEKWQPLLLQFALGAAAFALMFLGPGRLSLDAALLGGRVEDDDSD